MYLVNVSITFNFEQKKGVCFHTPQLNFSLPELLHYKIKKTFLDPYVLVTKY
jgi:hypothetical protein